MNNINIGEKIKNYRKQKQLTQEQLAEHLNISFQAVSKWECGDAYPDIAMLPRMAYFFNTTTDDLLCVDQVKIEEEIKDYLDRHSKLCNTGDTEAALALMREANAKYPGNFKLMNMLGFAIGWNSNTVDEEQRKKDHEEIVELSEKILDECNDNAIRFGVIQRLCFSLDSLGKKERAIEIVRKELPSTYLTTNIMLTHLLEGDELTKHQQINLTTFLEHTVDAMCSHSITRNFEPDEKLNVYENALKMYGFIYTDGDYHFQHTRIISKYEDMINICLKAEYYDRALSYIEKAKDHAVALDTLPTPAKYTSPLVNMTSEYKAMWKNYKGNSSYLLIKNLKEDKYDPIRDDERFKTAIGELEKYARDDI